MIMEQYIKKSTLVAEIERQISAIDDCLKITNTQISVLEGNKVILTKLSSFLDTIEMKEVDLEKEAERRKDMKTGIELIAEERQRQIDVEGYSKEHDLAA